MSYFDLLPRLRCVLCFPVLYIFCLLFYLMLYNIRFLFIQKYNILYTLKTKLVVCIVLILSEPLYILVTYLVRFYHLFISSIAVYLFNISNNIYLFFQPKNYLCMFSCALHRTSRKSGSISLFLKFYEIHFFVLNFSISCY